MCHYRKKSTVETGQKIRIDYNIKCSKSNENGVLSLTKVTDITSGEFFVAKRSLSKKMTLSFNFLGENIALPKDKVLYGVDQNEWLEGVLNKIISEKTKQKNIKGNKAAWERIRDFIISYSYLVFMMSTQRVASGRSGPKRWYPLTTKRNENFAPFDTGRSTYDDIDPSMIRDIMVGKASKYSKLKRILLDLNIASDITDDALSLYHRGINIKDNVTGIKSKLIDVGYGASQVLPIISGCLSDSEGPLLVEQPEIHLHPNAQGIIAELLCESSKRRQVIIETHSEHMINRARILVARGDIDPEDVLINYVSREKNGSCVHKIPIKRNGDFGSEWPTGFFDERYQDTMQLAQLSNSEKD